MGAHQLWTLGHPFDPWGHRDVQALTRYDDKRADLTGDAARRLAAQDQGGQLAARTAASGKDRLGLRDPSILLPALMGAYWNATQMP